MEDLDEMTEGFLASRDEAWTNIVFDNVTRNKKIQVIGRGCVGGVHVIKFSCTKADYNDIENTLYNRKRIVKDGQA